MRTTLLLLLVPAISCAQTGRGFVPVEGFVGAADAVYVGTIKGFERNLEAPPMAEPMSYGKAYHLTFSVSETIKGPPTKTGEFDLSVQSPFLLQYLQEHRVEIMLAHSKPGVFLSDIRQLGVDGSYYHFRLLEPVRADRNDTWGNQANISSDFGRFFGLGLNVVRTRLSVLHLARRYAAKHKEAQDLTYVQIPNSWAEQVGYPNAYAVVGFPVSPESEPTLRKMIQKPEWLLEKAGTEETKSRDWWLKNQAIEGIRAIRAFRNDANIRLLKDITAKSNNAELRNAAESILEEWAKDLVRT